MPLRPTLLALLLAAASIATWSTFRAGDSAARSAPDFAQRNPFVSAELGKFNEPWAMAIVPGTGVIFVTERGGTIKGREPNGRAVFVTGVPKVAYGGQGGLGDIAFLGSESATQLTPRTIFLSYAEAGPADTHGAVVGRGRLVCEEHQTCAIRDLQVIWRQSPKTTGQGHYSHRILFSPDERYLYLASGDRQKMQPAQDITGNLGKVVRVLADGTLAPDNPYADQGGVTSQIWSLGHRNILGLRFDGEGRLWGLEHGPRGGDELNLVEKGRNYGWPLVSEGRHYGGRAIPHHTTRAEFAAPAISWDPVIAPGDFIFYRGSMFPEWRGQALIAALGSQGIVRVAIAGTTAQEIARYDMQTRIRSIAEQADGSLLVLEDGEGGRLLRLTPRQR